MIFNVLNMIKRLKQTRTLFIPLDILNESMFCKKNNNISVKQVFHFLLISFVSAARLSCFRDAPSALSLSAYTVRSSLWLCPDEARCPWLGDSACFMTITATCYALDLFRTRWWNALKACCILLVRFESPLSYTVSVMHYNGVIMSTMASQITSLTIVTQAFIQAQIKENTKAPYN